MEKEPKIELRKEKEFEYKIQAEDLNVLIESADNLFDSTLLDPTTLRSLRIITFDSKNFYIITQGEHRSTEKYKVEELKLNTKSRNNFRIYKINHKGWIGDYRYRGATAWFEHEAIISTAVVTEEELVPNPKITKEKNKILKTILIPPYGPYEEIHQGRFDYQTSTVFHEAGHIEEMLIRDWPNEGEIPSFPSEKQKEDFINLIRNSSLASSLPREVVNNLVDNIDRATIGEMYATLVEREAERRFNPERIEREDEEFDKKLEEFLKSLENDNGERPNNKLKEVMESAHKKGYLLARILEKEIPDYIERKIRLQRLMRESSS